MNEPLKIKFKVDEQYENEKGTFRVISMHKGQMVIRWQNGEEVRTNIELQRRIAERRQWEKHAREAQAAAKTSPRSASTRVKSAFSGFAQTDFKKSAAQTTWRSRGQLGAAVTQKIDVDRFKFNSWAFGQKPEMHVQDIKQRGRVANDYQAKFFIRVDQQALNFGFRVARSDNTESEPTDWEAFMEWLTQQENEQMVHALAMKDNLTCRLINPSSATLPVSEYDWPTDEQGPQPDQKTLTAFINAAPEAEPFDLELSATIGKADAVAFGRDIAANIAQLFTRLFPLYQAAVTH